MARAVDRSTVSSRVRVPVLGVEVTPLGIGAVLDLIAERPERPVVIVGHNLHSIYLFHTDDRFRDAYERADHVLVDGQPVRWAGLLSGARRRFTHDVRIGSVDWLRAMDRRQAGLRIVVVGADAATNARTSEYLRQRTGATVTGVPGMPWDAEAERAAIAQIAADRPDLVLVGLGMPLQERVLSEHLGALPPAHYALVGGAIDQLTGSQRRAPALVGRLGLEWLWRLALSPRRLGHRYLVEPFKLAYVLVRGRR